MLRRVAVLFLISLVTAACARPADDPPAAAAATGPDVDRFWALMAASAAHSEDLEEREEWLVRTLAARPKAEIIAFAGAMAKVRAPADTWAMWDASDAVQGWSSDDVFWYFQGWLLSLPRAAYDKAVADPDTLAALPGVEDAEFTWEGIDHVADQAAETDLDLGHPVVPGPPGERPKDRTALPRLRALFPGSDELFPPIS